MLAVEGFALLAVEGVDGWLVKDGVVLDGDLGEMLLHVVYYY